MGATKKISIELGVLDYLPTFLGPLFQFQKKFFSPCLLSMFCTNAISLLYFYSQPIALLKWTTGLMIYCTLTMIDSKFVSLFTLSL